ncbi:tyrosine-type recombinase/integrase [candidate division KSB1 bacterium]
MITWWKDVNFERNLVFLRHTKTGKTRMVPMNKKLEGILKDMYIENQEGKLFNYHYDTVTHKFKRYVRKAGLSDEYSLKTTRKTFASHLVMQNVDLSTVQELLGHASPETTRKHYAKLADEHLQKSVRKLPY